MARGSLLLSSAGSSFSPPADTKGMPVSITLETAIEALREYERAFAECCEQQPEVVSSFHTSRLAAARGRATRLLGEHDAQSTRTSPYDRLFGR